MASPTGGVSAAAAVPPLRQFSFFDVEPVKDVHDLASPPEIFKNVSEISTTAPSSVGMLVADMHGSIHILNRDFVSTTSWVAHVGGRVTHMAEGRGILVTLGEEDSIRPPLLKIWELNKVDTKTGAPNLLRSTKIQPNNRPHPVSCIALSAALSYLAIGIGDGTVLLYRHLDQSIFSGSTSLTALPKTRTVHEVPTEPITGLGFKEPTEADPNLHLFIVTTSNVRSYHVSGRGSGGSPAIVDEVGCGLGCATMDWRAKDIVLAREDAVYVCGTEGRGTTYSYEGHKSSIHTHLNYVVFVSPPFSPSAASASATVRNFVAKNASIGETDITKVTILDLENKIIAYSGAFVEGVREVISEWGHIYILTNDGKLSSLIEKPTSAKLDMLYQKALYPLALGLAQTQRLDDSHVADIHRRYGDNLYAKGDYDGAMQQFVQTIGQVQPSYVIRKFLDAQRIHNLVTYLQELHALGLANSDHTTLLLNTYTKLKDVSRLDSFIKTESRRVSSDDELGELPFDLDTAIRVCRQAGYFEHASYLAKKYERHEDYLRIQVEDAGNFGDALVYLRKLGAETAESNLARYGRAMLNSLPEETTQLLIDLCTTVGRVSPTKKPSPRMYFAHFVDHMGYFLIFLESVARKRWGQSVDGPVEPLSSEPPVDEQAEKRDQVSVWNTLLELYLTLPDSQSGGSLREKAIRLLKSDLTYDPTHALILCSSHQYTPGLVLLWEKMGMYESVVRFWMDRDKEGEPGASAEVVRALEVYGASNSNLYPLVLRFLTSSSELLSRHQADIGLVLEHIEQEKIMPPLGVIQVLSRNGVASVGLIKEWLMTRITEAREEMQTDQQLINSYRLETKTRLKQVEELSDPEHPKVFHVTQCKACGGQLDLPSIHFMCNHSYHQRCLLDNDTECPACARQHGVIQEIRRTNERLADQHDLFLSEVKENGFRAVAGGFSRGVLNLTGLEAAV